jgi:5'/3'-nucleotidase SurE
VNILLTNDDGLKADGLIAAYEALTKRGHQVTACAPDRQRSGQSQAVTLRVPLTASPSPMPGGQTGYAISGTPADCARLGFTTLAPKPLDLVISGINDDANLGYDANYSGTAAAALEAAGEGLPSMAVSLGRGEGPHDWDMAAAVLVEAAESFSLWKIPPGLMVNINIPPMLSDPLWAWTTLNPYPSPDRYVQTGPDSFIRRRFEEDCRVLEGSDIDLFRAGRISLSPVGGVAHDQQTLQRLKASIKLAAHAQKSL